MTTEKRTVTIDLGGVSKEIEIRRITGEGGTHGCWYTDTPVLVRFPSGTKTHTARRPLVRETPHQDFRIDRVVVANRSGRAIAWADGSCKATSQWKRERR